jgi:uncharacterized Zn-finger protein
MRRSTPFFFNWLSDPSRVRFAPGSLFYTAGPGFRWSLLNYGRITNNVRAQDARFQQALVNYENILNASKEVEDALIGFLKEFMCIGESPPQDHPHVYINMGEADTILCPYCATRFRFDPRLTPLGADPPDSFFADHSAA